jgi:hypothetical protein
MPANGCEDCAIDSVAISDNPKIAAAAALFPTDPNENICASHFAKTCIDSRPRGFKDRFLILKRKTKFQAMICSE